MQQCNLGINSNFLQNVHLYNLNERQPSLDYILLVFCRDAQGSLLFFGAGQGTLLPDVHFLEQLWQEQIYYCKMRRNSPEHRNTTGVLQRISPHFTIENLLLPNLLQNPHIYTGSKVRAGREKNVSEGAGTARANMYGAGQNSV